MRPAYLILALAISPSSGDDAEIARTADGALRLHPLTAAEADEFDGCSCAFYPPAGGQPLTGWYYTDDTVPGIPLRLNDRTERLTLVAEEYRRAADERPQVGDRTTYLLENASTKLTLACRISHTCWGEAECEFIDYACTAHVDALGRRLSTPVQGGCGC